MSLYYIFIQGESNSFYVFGVFVMWGPTEPVKLKSCAIICYKQLFKNYHLLDFEWK